MILTILKMNNKTTLNGVGGGEINISYFKKTVLSLYNTRLQTKSTVHKYCSLVSKFVLHRCIG